MPARKSTARWSGDLKSGNGTMKMQSGAYEGQYSFSSRFEEGTGTNPEELIAAAHAGCFSMALSAGLSKAGFVPDHVDTEATVHIEKQGEGFGITRIVLRTDAKVPNIDEATFLEQAEGAKKNCPVSQALNSVKIELEAKLVS